MIEKLKRSLQNDYDWENEKVEKINEIIEGFNALKQKVDLLAEYCIKSPESTSELSVDNSTASKDTNTQNLKGCGEICANCGKKKSSHYEVPILEGEKPIFECSIVRDNGRNYRFKKCQGKMK